MISMESLETEINKILKETIPIWKITERELLILVRDSIINDCMWAYNNLPYDKFDKDKFDRVARLLKELKSDIKS